MVEIAEIREANRLSWNRARSREAGPSDDEVRFFLDGGQALYREEMEQLGDIRGQSLVHLQCGRGTETVSLAQALGAHAVGIDISEVAVEAAEKLAAATGIPASFVCADVYEWMERPETEAVDVVFASYGVIPWLHDLDRWGRGVHRLLKPGGRFVLVDYHPMAFVFDDEGEWRPQFDYLGGAGDCCRAYSHAWGIGETVSALLRAGLELRDLQEYPFCNGWRPFPRMEEREEGRLYLPEGLPRLPLMYSVVCGKP